MSDWDSECSDDYGCHPYYNGFINYGYYLPEEPEDRDSDNIDWAMYEKCRGCYRYFEYGCGNYDCEGPCETIFCKECGEGGVNCQTCDKWLCKRCKTRFMRELKKGDYHCYECRGEAKNSPEHPLHSISPDQVSLERSLNLLNEYKDHLHNLMCLHTEDLIGVKTQLLKKS
jgi:hypothetical protein